MDAFFKGALWVFLILSFIAMSEDDRFLEVFFFVAFILWLINRVEKEMKADNEKWEMESKIRELGYKIEDLRREIRYKLKD